jgi:RHS repeat-associated protein
VDGNTAWEAELQPYGSANIKPSSSLVLNLRFPSHYFDELTGLHYNRFRYYDPRLGRYLQSDPLGIAGGINLHAYPANPLVKVDVRGLVATSCPCPVCGGAHPPEACPSLESAFSEQPTGVYAVVKWNAGVLNHVGNGEPGLDMIIVATSQGWQGFYRSDGRNAGEANRGRWFPFDEVFEREAAGRGEGWVNKMRSRRGETFRSIYLMGSKIHSIGLEHRRIEMSRMLSGEWISRLENGARLPR